MHGRVFAPQGDSCDRNPVPLQVGKLGGRRRILRLTDIHLHPHVRAPRVRLDQGLGNVRARERIRGDEDRFPRSRHRFQNQRLAILIKRALDLRGNRLNGNRIVPGPEGFALLALVLALDLPGEELAE